MAAPVLDLSERVYQGEDVSVWLTTRPPESVDDLIFASVDERFNGGQLNEYVSRQTGIPLPLAPPEGGRFMLVPGDSGHQSLALIQTVEEGKGSADSLADNLRAFTEAHELEAERIWVPFMGTGSGGLSFPDAGGIIAVNLLQARLATSGNAPLEIDLALPRETDGEEFMRLRDWLEGYLEEVFPAGTSEAPVPLETQKLLGRVFYASLRKGAEVVFEFNELLSPTAETVIFVTEAALSTNPAFDRLLEPPKDRALITLSANGRDVFDEVNMGADKGVIDMRRMPQIELNAHLVAISDKMTTNADNADDEVMDVFIPVEPSQSEKEHKTIADFVAAISSSTIPDVVQSRLTFRLAFNEPLSDADHAALRRTIQTTIEDLGGTYQPPAKVASNAPNEMPAQFHSDHALTDPSQDELGRDAIAGAIATNVQRVWADQKKASRPFVVHLSGRWGSGKSSILTFLEAKLRADTRFTKTSPGTIYPQKPKGWCVVHYNAWQMQEAGRF